MGNRDHLKAHPKPYFSYLSNGVSYTVLTEADYQEYLKRKAIPLNNVTILP